MQFRQFIESQDGAATTEYLALLAILLGGVLVSVILMADHISQAYGSWGAFFRHLADGT